MCAALQAEVQSFYADGAIALHTRSLKYGKVSKNSSITLLSTISNFGAKKQGHLLKLAKTFAWRC